MINLSLDQLRDPDLRELGSEPLLLRLEDFRDDLPFELLELFDLRSVFRFTSPSSIVPRQPPSGASSSIST